jgi:glycosyltransferase involved in cell wall biosynthesis
MPIFRGVKNDSSYRAPSDDTIVVVPCFNEAQRLQPAAFSDFLDRSPDVVLLLVDDGSTDDTPFILERLRQQHPRQLWTLRLSTNVGKAEAVRRGVLAALRRHPKFIGYWDADLAAPLDAIVRMREVLRARNELALVMGSRVALLGRRIERSGFRHLAGRAFATAASLVLGLPVYDTQCGAKLFRVTTATHEVFSRPFHSRWIFDVEILARMVAESEDAGGVSARKVIYEYPLERWRDVRGSRLRPVDFVVAAVDLAAIFWRYRHTPSAAGSDSSPGIPHPSSSILKRDAA